jgi:hypothetical protein
VNAVKTFLLLLVAATAAADTLVLQTGETLTGDVVEQTDALVSIRLFNPDRTIAFVREIPRADVKQLTIEPAAAKAQRVAHDALRAYRLDPDQEWSAAWYAAGIAAFEKFLAAHPTGPLAEDVRQRLAAWQTDLRHLGDGRVKFRNRWLLPAEKAPLVAAARLEAERAVLWQELIELKQRLAQRERERETLRQGMIVAEANLRGSEHGLANLPDVVVPIVEDRLTSVPFVSADGSRYWPAILEYERMVVGEKVVVHPDRRAYEQRVIFYARQVAEGQAALARLDTEITDLQDRLRRAEDRWQTLVAR